MRAALRRVEPARASAHRDAAERRRDEVHHAVVEREQTDTDSALRKERIVLLGRGENRVSERQRGLGYREHERSGQDVIPRQLRDSN